MNRKDIIFLDFETTGRNPHTCQPIELAAVCIDGRRLEIKETETFQSFIKPIFDEQKCLELNLEPVSDEVLKITNIDRKDIEKAPSIDVVWPAFCDFVNKFNPKKDNWKAPIMAGFNVDGYDAHIINRLCGGHSWYKSLLPQTHLTKLKESGIKIEEPYGFGPWDDTRCSQKLFGKIVQVDLMDVVWLWTENTVDFDSISMKAVREWLGIDSEGAHRAMKDVMDGAETLIRFLKLKRKIAPDVNFRSKKVN